MKKSNFLYVIIFSMLIMCFAGCSGDDNTQTESPDAGQESKEESMNERIEESSVPILEQVDEETARAYKSYDISKASHSKGSIATSEEQKDAEEYFTSLFADLSYLPISFKLDGKQYHGFNDEFTLKRSDGIIEAKHNSGLVFIVSYGYNFEYAAFEWVVYIRNDGNKNSAVISDLYVADIDFIGENPLLHYMLGESTDDVNGYALKKCDFKDKTFLSLVSDTHKFKGMSTVDNAPYHRFFYGNGGMSIALGWQGIWRMDYTASTVEGITTTNLKAGQNSFASYLKSGEEIRTPQVTMIKYGLRDNFHAINMWRRWFLDCAFYRYNGEIQSPVRIMEDGCIPWSDFSVSNINAVMKKINALKDYSDKNYMINIWLDAGWYFKNGTTRITDWAQTGTWRMDTTRFPQGFKPASDALAQKNGFTNLWFEPERVFEGTELFEKEEWTVTNPEVPSTKLLNFGIKEVRDWWIEMVDSIMTDSGISMYRQDGNIKVYYHYVYGDIKQGKNRTGITENLHIKGLTETYGEILSRHGTMPMDMCASGGQRNDMDALRIAMMYTCSDTSRTESTLMQNRRLEMYCWSPFFCGSNPLNTSYNFLSNISYNMTLLSEEDCSYWEQINRLFLCDYFPLTEWTTSENTWWGFECYDTEFNEGFLCCARRPQSEKETENFKIQDLKADKHYEVINVFTNKSEYYTGAYLAETGLDVTCDKGDGVLVRIIEVEEITPKASVDKEKYSDEDTVIISYCGINGDAYICLIPDGKVFTEYVPKIWNKLDTEKGDFEYAVSLIKEYEVALSFTAYICKDSQFNNENSVLAKVSFELKSQVEQDPNPGMFIDKAVLNKGESVVISYRNYPENTTVCFIPVGSSLENYVPSVWNFLEVNTDKREYTSDVLLQYLDPGEYYICICSDRNFNSKTQILAKETIIINN